MEHPPRFNHNRKRNSGLVYEFLVRQVASSLVEGDAETARRAVSLIERHYGSGTPLARELEIFEAVRGSRGVNQQVARRVLSEAMSRAEILDMAESDRAKSKLVSDLNRSFGRDFFSRHRVPEYRAMASVQLLIDSAGRRRSLTDDVARLQLEESVIDFIASQPEASKPIDVELDRTVMDLAEHRFGERYASKLKPSQRKLLDGFACSMVSGDAKRLREQIVEEQARLLTEMRRARNLKEVVEDAEMKEKLEEAIASFQNLDASSDDAVGQILLHEALVEELRSSDG